MTRLETATPHIASTNNAANRRGVKQNCGVRTGACVLIVLREPREKCWGKLEGLNQIGVFVRGLDLSAFDDWTRSLAHGEAEISLSSMFFPLWRIERITRDEKSGAINALHEQLTARTGLTLNQIFDKQ